jgi:hypothetical protein
MTHHVAAAICPSCNRGSPVDKYRGAMNVTGQGGHYADSHDAEHALACARLAVAEGRASPGQMALVYIFDIFDECLKDSQLDGSRPHMEHRGARYYHKASPGMKLHGHDSGAFASAGMEPQHHLMLMCRLSKRQTSGYVMRVGGKLVLVPQPSLTFSLHDGVAQARGRRARVAGLCCTREGLGVLEGSRHRLPIKTCSPTSARIP